MTLTVLNWVGVGTEIWIHFLHQASFSCSNCVVYIAWCYDVIDGFKLIKLGLAIIKRGLAIIKQGLAVIKQGLAIIKLDLAIIKRGGGGGASYY